MARFQTVFFIGMFLQVFALGGELPRFHLVEIRVEGTRANVEGIVLAEARLGLGETYSESDLYAAMVRLRRLPFVLDAEFRLEKGSEFQTYILVIHINETRRLFIDGEARVLRLRRYPFLQEIDEVVGRNRLTLGYRTFPTSKSQLYAALSPGITLAERDQKLPFRATAGFAHHNLGGAGRFFNVEAFYSEGTTSYGSPNPVEVIEGTYWGLDVLYALPLKKNQWLRIGSGARRNEATFPTRYFDFSQSQSIVRQRFNDQEVAYLWGEWDWNTLNDHALPNSGMRLKPGLALVRQRTEFDLSQTENFERESFIDFRDALASFLTYEQYWHFLSRHTVFMRAGVRIAFESAETQESYLNIGGPHAEVIQKTELDANGNLAAGYIFDVFSGAQIENYGDFRLELAIQDSVEEDAFHPILGRSHTGENDSGTQNFSATLIFRNHWGVLRLGVSYGWD